MCLEDDQIKAFGAGLLSSYGELENAFGDKSVKLPFDIQTTALQKYDDVNYQPVYFITKSIQSMKKDLA